MIRRQDEFDEQQRRTGVDRLDILDNRVKIGRSLSDVEATERGVATRVIETINCPGHWLTSAIN